MAYRNLICLALITHFKSNYYNITPSALKENAACTTSTYDMNQPSKTVIDQTETDVNLADARRVPYTSEQVAITTYDLISSIIYFTNSS